MTLLHRANQRLFPEKADRFTTTVKYSRRLSPYNATIRQVGKHITLHANKNWEEIDEEIQIGLAQWLLLKLFKEKNKHTYNIDLYTSFIKTIPQVTPATITNPHLEASFARINEQFFHGVMQQPNLKWGRKATRKLACYDYHTNTVTVSSVFKTAPLRLLDFLMYHELLHKDLSFECKNNRSFYHTPEFRRKEAKYPGFSTIDKELNQFIRLHKKPKKKPKKQGLWRFFSTTQAKPLKRSGRDDRYKRNLRFIIS